MTSLRQQRVAEQIKVTLSELLLFDINDPRLSGITITEVEIDRELEYADVYVNALGDEERKEEVLEGLERASGFLRRRLGDSLDARKTPNLRFKWDTAFEQAQRIDDLLDSLNIPAPDEDSDAGTPD